MPGAALLADLLLVVHAGIVGFVVLGQVLIVIGGMRGWRWVRGLAFRLCHLATIGFVVVQSWMREVCPLTVWEQQLRRSAGQAAYDESFVAHWLSRIIFYDAPWWVFSATYTAFAAVVLASWWWWPPRRGAGRRARHRRVTPP